MHLVQYPIRRGELFNQAAVFKSRRLPDHTDQWGTKEELNERFSVGCGHVKTLCSCSKLTFDGLSTSELHVFMMVIIIIDWISSSRNPLSKWSRGRLVLLGDAAHPMLQYAAQGAAQALEDAVALVNAYKKYGPSRTEMIFRDYEQERIPRSSQVVQFARDIGTFAHHHGLMKINRDALLRQHEMNDFHKFKWLYADESKNEEW